MRPFKLSLALLSSALMAYAPVTEAAMKTDQKTAFNQMVGTLTQGNFNDLYRKTGGLMDESSRGFFEAWLQNYGQTKISKPQAQIVKTKNGTEQIKLVFNQFGKTVTMTIDPSNPEVIDLNGVQIAAGDLQNTQTVINALAEKDSSFTALANQLKGAPPKSRRSSVLTVEQFAKLKPIQRVEYMGLLRRVNEAGDRVEQAHAQPTSASRTPATDSLFALQPFLASQAAFAAAKADEPCIVAGNLSVYEVGKYWKWEGDQSKQVTDLHCPAYPKRSEKFEPLPVLHAECPGPAGRMVACPTMAYKLNITINADKTRTATPICQDISRKGFTESATAYCNEKSPLPGEDKSPERYKAYREILESYAIAKGGAYDKMAACFGSDDKVRKDCKSIFEAHVNAHKAYMDKVEKQCTPRNLKNKTKDQAGACEELLKRTLGLRDFLNEVSIDDLNPPGGGGTGRPPVVATPPTTPPTTPPAGGDAACTDSGGSMRDPGVGEPVCMCPDQSVAKLTPNGTYMHCGTDACGRAGGQMRDPGMGYPACMCPNGSVSTAKPDGEYNKCPEGGGAAIVTGGEKEKCKGGDKSFKCAPLLWIGGIALGGWLLSKLFKDRNKSSTTTTIWFPPWPPMTIPPSEGGTKPGGTDNAGGVRKQPQPKPAGGSQ